MKAHPINVIRWGFNIIKEVASDNIIMFGLHMQELKGMGYYVCRNKHYHGSSLQLSIGFATIWKYC